MEGETLEDYLGLFTWNALTWPDGSWTGQIVDDGGDATLLIHKGYELENGSDWVNFSRRAMKNKLLELLEKTLAEKHGHWAKVADAVVGVSEETTTGVHRLIQMQEEGKLLFQAGQCK